MRKVVVLPALDPERCFQHQCRPSLRTRVRKSQQLVKRLRSRCSHDVMLYLSRSNISCFTFHATLHNHKTLNVTKYIYTHTKDYFLFQPVFILLFSPLPPFLNKSPISNICPCYPYIQSVYTIAIQTGKQHILPPPNC